ncbi:MAG: uroporphyrinogen-III C-methyltransferase [Robiginitomaculum sp.]|nr:uroporphyrinogen-III C-methyltransferase [Robiginitomaculum sp.]
MRYLPIHIDLQGANILVVGGGALAEAKLRTLVTTPARLLVVARTVSKNIKDWASAGKLIWERRAFTSTDLDGKTLIYAASGDTSQDKAIAKQAGERGLLVNAADDKMASGFFSPAIISRAPVSISIGTEGHSPGIARLIKAEIEAILPGNLGTLTRTLSRIRTTLPKKRPEFTDRLAFWKAMFKGESLTSLCTLDDDGVENKANHYLVGKTSTPKGRVTLVGGGPGDPDLLTRQAARQLGVADVIVYDRLVSQAVLDVGRREAEYIYVGKQPGGQITSQETTSQEAINALLVKKAKAGHHVVRLKGGDPLVFGRADEEIEALEKAGIAFDICPGITAAAAAAAAIGMSLTTRGVNTSVTLLSGHDARGYAQHDWASLAKPDARALIYMGLGASGTIRAQLLAHKASPDTPITIVENASQAGQKIMSSSLGTIVQDLQRNHITGPAILMLGYEPRKKNHEQQKAQGQRPTSHHRQRFAQRRSRVFEPEISLDASAFQGMG